MFIFLNDAWYNIVLAFKLNNIELNGGKFSSRHIMKPSDFVLGTFINKLMLSCDSEISLDNINKFYSNSYKNEMLSSSIDLSLYQNYKNNEYAFKHLDAEHFVNQSEKLNESANIIKAYLSDNYNTYCVLLRKEIKYKFDIFVKNEIVKKELMENYSRDIRRTIKIKVYLNKIFLKKK